MKKAGVFILIFLCYYTAVAQTMTIRGKVLDAKTNEPLVGATVGLKDTRVGTYAEVDGSFSIKTDLSEVVLLVQYVGYDKQEIQLKAKTKHNLTIKLVPQQFNLESLVVKAKENPAITILRKTLKNKQKNNPTTKDQFSGTLYTRVETMIGNLNEEMLQSGVLKGIQDKLPKGEDSLAYLPILLSEKVSKLYYNHSTRKQNSKIIANKQDGIAGLDNVDISEYVDGMEDFNFYEPYFEFFYKKFTSPVSFVGFNQYKYRLRDTMVVDEDTVYNIHFSPLRVRTPVFFGNLHVRAKDGALMYITAKLPRKVNANYIRDMHLDFEFQKLPNGEVFYRKSHIFVSFYYRKLATEREVPLLVIRQTHLYDSIRVGEEAIPFEQPNVKAYVSESVSDSVISNYKSSVEDSASIEFMNAIEEIRKVWWVNLTDKLFSMFQDGYIPFGKLDLGPYLNLLKANKVEGFRMTLTGRTSDDFHPNLIANAKIGYGFKNKGIRYGAGLGWKFNTTKRLVIEGSFEDEIRLIGEDRSIFYLKENQREKGEDNIIAAVLRPSLEDRLNRQLNTYILLEKQWNTVLTTRFLFDSRKEFSPQYYPFTYQNENVEYIFSNTIGVNFRLSFKQKILDKFYRRYYLDTRYPVFNFILSAVEYHLPTLEPSFAGKIHMTMYHALPTGQALLKYFVETGAIAGAVPYTLLNIPRGNASYGYKTYSFNLLKPASIGGDTYFGTTLEYHLNGIVFDKIPLIRALNFREVFTVKYLYTDARETHKKVLDVPDVLSTNLYHHLELGAGIENIFQYLRVEGIYRPISVKDESQPKWAIKFKLQIDI